MFLLKILSGYNGQPKYLKSLSYAFYCRNIYSHILSNATVTFTFMLTVLSLELSNADRSPSLI